MTTTYRRTFAPITREILRSYSRVSGDQNPVHLDPGFARSAGFEDVIAYGMLLMAFLCETLCDVVPSSQLQRLMTRFVSVTALGATITCTIENEGVVVDHGERLMKFTISAADEHGVAKLAGEAYASPGNSSD